jgi:hypothetical protein
MLAVHQIATDGKMRRRHAGFDAVILSEMMSVALTLHLHGLPHPSSKTESEAAPDIPGRRGGSPLGLGHRGSLQLQGVRDLPGFVERLLGFRRPTLVAQQSAQVHEGPSGLR